MFKDINGRALNDGDRIRFKSGRTAILHRRDYSGSDTIRGSYFGGRMRLCIGSSISEPTPDYVESEMIEKI